MQLILVLFIIAATLFFVVRRIVRTAKGKGGGCACGCSHCPHSGAAECHCHDHSPKLPDIKV